MTEEVIRVLKEARKKALKEIKNVKIVYDKIWKDAAEEYYYTLVANYGWKNRDDYYDLMDDLIVHPLVAQKDCGVILTDEGMELLDDMLVRDGFTFDEPTNSYAINPLIVENAINESNDKTNGNVKTKSLK